MKNKTILHIKILLNKSRIDHWSIKVKSSLMLISDRVVFKIDENNVFILFFFYLKVKMQMTFNSEVFFLKWFFLSTYEKIRVLLLGLK
jgi:hypothetical protein